MPDTAVRQIPTHLVQQALLWPHFTEETRAERGGHSLGFQTGKVSSQASHPHLSKLATSALSLLDLCYTGVTARGHLEYQYASAPQSGYMGNSFRHLFTAGLEMSRGCEKSPSLVSHLLGAPNM